MISGVGRRWGTERERGRGDSVWKRLKDSVQITQMLEPSKGQKMRQKISVSKYYVETPGEVEYPRMQSEIYQFENL